jgi:two-component system sensor histidine kinase AlgZ
MADNASNQNDLRRAGLPEPFLPDFCSAGTTMSLVLLAAFLSLLLTLAASAEAEGFWSRLGVCSLFVVWVALLSEAILCVLSKRLATMYAAQASLCAFLATQGVAFAIGWLAYRVLPDLGVMPANSATPFMMARNAALAGLISAVWLRYQYVQHQRQRQVRAESTARMDALQARIRPHFLFNSLNAIASLVRRDPGLAEELLLDLAELFRAILKQESRFNTLEEEIGLTRQYLNIEFQRLGERLHVDWLVDAAPMDALTPPLSLQPLVENAIYHGVEPCEHGGEVEILARLRKGEIVLTVSNSLPETRRRARRKGNRMAVENLRLRLLNSFPDRGQLLTSVVDDRYQVCMVFPYRTRADEDTDSR